MTEPLVTQFNLPPGMIDLGMGDPDLSLLPLEALRASAEIYFEGEDVRSLQYGIEQGDGYLRGALADFLSQGYGASVDPGQLFVTTGASPALDLLCTLYARPGDLVYVEEPTYFLALSIFEEHGLRVESLPMDAEGLRLDALEEKLAAAPPKFLYIIPSFQNPTGRTLPLERRERLVELAQSYDFLILADEVYHFLSYGAKPPAPFASFSEQVEQVISVNSFSKILAPGLRLGWIQAHDNVLKRLTGSGQLDSGGGMGPFTSALVRGLVASGGLAENINKLRGEYARRRDAMAAALEEHIPTAEYAMPQGGFFFWLRLPGVNAAELRQRAEGHQLGLRQGELFSSQGGLQEYVRLCFCYYEPEAITEGIKRLADCLAEYSG